MAVPMAAPVPSVKVAVVPVAVKVGASFTAATLIVAELGVDKLPSDTLKLRDATPLKLAFGV